MMKREAPAKINLHLRVGPVAPSGFHPLLSWMCTTGLQDGLTVTSAAKTTLTCNDSALACDESNLVIRAVRALEREVGMTGRTLAPVAIALDKSIPTGGGLGGGSSNAAATLQLLNDFLQLQCSPTVLHRLAAEIGSDVPFFLSAPSALCQGRGEIVSPVPPPQPKAVVLILPPIAMPTPAVYRKFDELRLGHESALRPPADFDQWCTLAADPLLARLVNDLETPAFAIEPSLGVLRAEIEQWIGRIVRMSGSGSSLFTLCEQSIEADTIAWQIRERMHVRAFAAELAPVGSK